jgi:hypothetical protein
MARRPDADRGRTNDSAYRCKPDIPGPAAVKHCSGQRFLGIDYDSDAIFHLAGTTIYHSQKPIRSSPAPADIASDDPVQSARQVVNG